MKKTIKQTFIDLSFKCVRLGLSNYKIIILSGFDLEDKQSKFLSLALIPSQKETTITKFLNIIKTFIYSIL